MSKLGFSLLVLVLSTTIACEWRIVDAPYDASRGGDPSGIGVGVDEDTAMILDHRNLVEVVGRHSVTFVDGADITFTDIHQVKQHANVAVYNLRVHVLTHGQRFDLVARQPLLPMHVLTQSAPVALEAADDE